MKKKEAEFQALPAAICQLRALNFRFFFLLFAARQRVNVGVIYTLSFDVNLCGLSAIYVVVATVLERFECCIMIDPLVLHRLQSSANLHSRARLICRKIVASFFFCMELANSHE